MMWKRGVSQGVKIDHPPIRFNNQREIVVNGGAGSLEGTASIGAVLLLPQIASTVVHSRAFAQIRMPSSFIPMIPLGRGFWSSILSGDHGAIATRPLKRRDVYSVQVTSYTLLQIPHLSCSILSH